MNYFDTLIGNDFLNTVCNLIVFFVVIANLLYLFKGYHSSTGFFVLWLIITIYSVFYSPEDGDNFSSLNNYYSYLDGTPEEYLHFEPIYFRIMDLVPYGYVVWRFFIWGIGALLLVLFLNKIKFEKSVSTVSILYFSLPLLFYQRAIIGYVLIYIGLAFLSNIVISKSNLILKLKNLILAIICFLGALFFHTTMVFYVIVALLSLLIIMCAPKRHIFIILLGLIIVIISFLPNLINIFIEIASEETQNTAILYLENAKLGAKPTLFGYIGLFLYYGPFYGMLSYCVWNINNFSLSFNVFEKTVLINTAILVVISIIFASISVSIQGKFYTASLLPWGLFIASFYTKRKESKVARVYFKVTIVSFILLKCSGILSSLW